LSRFPRLAGRDPCEAVALYEKAAEQGSTDAKVNLAVKLMNGSSGLMQDVPSAKVLLAEVATNQVHPVAEFNLALIAEKEANHILAIELYSKAAAAGHTESMVNLGSLLLAQAQRQSETTGYGLRNRRNMEAASLGRAARLYQEAALRGNPRAMYNLAAMTLEGQGIEPNQAVAAQLFGQAAMLGLAEAEPHAPRCAVCGRFAASACGGCGTAWYCGVECQRVHWAEHSSSCSGASNVAASIMRRYQMAQQVQLKKKMGHCHAQHDEHLQMEATQELLVPTVMAEGPPPAVPSPLPPLRVVGPHD